MFDISNQDIQKVIDTTVLSKNPLVFSNFPVKEKRKYIVLCMIIHFFEKDTKYHESEVNEILKPMIHDFATVRRYLVDYKFLDRTTDGKSYWLIEDLEKFKKYDIGH